jgi:hypothetical protein
VLFLKAFDGINGVRTIVTIGLILEKSGGDEMFLEDSDGFTAIA